MKRNERNTYNGLKKNVTNDTIYVEIPVAWSHEGRQAIHELLTIEKGMHACRLCPNVLSFETVVLYARGTDAAQENADIDFIAASLPVSEYCWNGYRPA